MHQISSKRQKQRGGDRKTTGNWCKSVETEKKPSKYQVRDKSIPQTKAKQLQRDAKRLQMNGRRLHTHLRSHKTATETPNYKQMQTCKETPDNCTLATLAGPIYGDAKTPKEIYSNRLLAGMRAASCLRPDA